MNWKTPVTMIVLVLVVIGGALVGWRYATQEVPSLRDATGNDPQQECRTYDSGQALRTNAVTVNVFNTGGISGLAGETMRDLIQRGFIGGVAENADRRVPGGRVLLTARDPKSPQVRLVREQLKGKVVTRVADDPDVGTGVNMFMGDRFRGLKPDAPRRVRVRGSTEVCFEVEQR